MDRYDLVEARLKYMIKMVDHGCVADFKELADKDLYVRLNGESIRLVSLRDDYPLCGEMDKCKDRKKIDSYILNNIDSKTEKVLHHDILKSKEERRIQCRIIKYALLNDRSMLNCIDRNGDYFDKLLFAMDEVSVGDKLHSPTLRCDILGVGVVNNKPCPVIIELKSSRSKARLEDQLSFFAKEMSDHKESFSELLYKITGIKPEGDVQKVIFWPQLKTKKTQTAEAIAKSGVVVVEYSFGSANCGFCSNLETKLFCRGK